MHNPKMNEISWRSCSKPQRLPQTWESRGRAAEAKGATAVKAGRTFRFRIRRILAMPLIALGAMWVGASLIACSRVRGEAGWTNGPARLWTQAEFGAVILAAGLVLAYRAFRT